MPIYDEEFLTAQGIILFDMSSTWTEEKLKQQMLEDNYQYDGVFRGKSKSEVLKTKKLFIPTTYSTCDRLLVDMLEGVINDTEEIVDVGSWKGVPGITKQLATTILNYRLNGNPINFWTEYSEFAQDCIKNFRGFFKVFPRWDRDNVFTPMIECAPPEDMFMHPNATWKNYYKYPIIHRMKKTIDELKRNNHKNLEKFKNFNMSSPVDIVKQQRLEDTGSPFVQNTKVEGQNEAYLYEIWDFLDINSDGFLESVVYYMGGDETGPKFVTKKAEENDLPYKFRGDDYNRPPIICGYILPEAHKQKGKSVPEIMSGLQKEENAIRNQRRERTALALRSPLLINKSAGLDLRAAVNRKMGSVIVGNDISPNAVRELNLTGPDPNTNIDLQNVKSDIWELTSIPPDLQGSPSLKDDTATGVSSRVSNANKKIRKMIMNIIFTGVIPALKFLLRLEQEYESNEFIEWIVESNELLPDDEDGNPMTISDSVGVPAKDIIQGEIDLKIRMGLNKDAQLNKMFLLIDRINQQNQITASLLQIGVVNPQDVHFMSTMPLTHRILQILGEKNIGEYMIQGQQPPPELTQGGAKGVASQPAGTTQNNGEFAG